jgi:hypothetical protein
MLSQPFPGPLPFWDPSWGPLGTLPGPPWGPPGAPLDPGPPHNCDPCGALTTALGGSSVPSGPDSQKERKE